MAIAFKEAADKDGSGDALSLTKSLTEIFKNIKKQKQACVAKNFTEEKIDAAVKRVLRSDDREVIQPTPPKKQKTASNAL